MFIHEAVSEALHRECCIARRSWRGRWKIHPTNDKVLSCVAIIVKDGKSAPRWNPNAEDLLASDWEITA